jgi:hypothetical protein
VIVHANADDRAVETSAGLRCDHCGSAVTRKEEMAKDQQVFAPGRRLKVVTEIYARSRDNLTRRANQQIGVKRFSFPAGERRKRGASIIGGAPLSRLEFTSHIRAALSHKGRGQERLARSA